MTSQLSNRQSLARTAGIAIIAWPTIPALVVVGGVALQASRPGSGLLGLILIFLAVLWVPVAVGAYIWGAGLLKAASPSDERATRRGERLFALTPFLGLGLGVASIYLGLPLWTDIPLAVAVVACLFAQPLSEPYDS